jgi:LPXTG-motif cell wall-anchored protein
MIEYFCCNKNQRPEQFRPSPSFRVCHADEVSVTQRQHRRFTGRLPRDRAERGPGKKNMKVKEYQMKLMKILPIALFVLAACAFLLPTAVADEWNNKTIVTFSEPVEVPGVGAQVLPAGTYIFKLMDSTSNRNIVQIFSADGNHLFTTILAIPNYRLKVTGKTVMTFRERGEGQPEAIRAWFYPGANWGQEFVYPKSRAIQLAAIVKEPVLATPIEVAEAPVEVLRSAPVEAVAPTGETIDMATVVEPPPAPVVEEAPAAVELPQTASFVPLFGLIGLMSLGTGVALWMFTKKNANERARLSNRAS